MLTKSFNTQWRELKSQICPLPGARNSLSQETIRDLIHDPRAIGIEKDTRTVPPPGRVLLDLPSHVDSPFILRCYIPSETDEELEDKGDEEEGPERADRASGAGRLGERVDSGDGVDRDDAGITAVDFDADNQNDDQFGASFQVDAVGSSPFSPYDESVNGGDNNGGQTLFSSNGNLPSALARDAHSPDVFAFLDHPDWDQNLLNISTGWG